MNIEGIKKLLYRPLLAGHFSYKIKGLPGEITINCNVNRITRALDIVWLWTTEYGEVERTHSIQQREFINYSHNVVKLVYLSEVNLNRLLENAQSYGIFKPRPKCEKDDCMNEEFCNHKK